MTRALESCPHLINSPFNAGCEREEDALCALPERGVPTACCLGNVPGEGSEEEGLERQKERDRRDHAINVARRLSSSKTF